MVFITAGMGGGTGTGAAPVIARLSKEMEILTVGVVTLPFRDEKGFLKRAIKGIKELQKHVDSLILIDNQKIYRLYGEMSSWMLSFPNLRNSVCNSEIRVSISSSFCGLASVLLS